MSESSKRCLTGHVGYIWDEVGGNSSTNFIMSSSSNSSSKDSQSKRWAMTIWDHMMPAWEPEIMNYLICGLEICPTTERVHYQCYVEFKTNWRFSRIRHRYGEGNRYFAADGTAEENRIYCSKDGNFVEHGTPSPGQGKRTDIDSLAELCKKKKRLRDVALEMPGMFIKYHKGITALMSVLKVERDYWTQGYYLIGESGSGKTSYVYKKHGAENIYVKDPTTKWWDGYEGQEVILLDDFRGMEEKQCMITYSNILTWVDRYKCKVEIKGGFIELQAKHFYITSNTYPQAWFGSNLTAFERRFKEIDKSVFTDPMPEEAQSEIDE